MQARLGKKNKKTTASTTPLQAVESLGGGGSPRVSPVWGDDIL